MVIVWQDILVQFLVVLSHVGNTMFLKVQFTNEFSFPALNKAHIFSYPSKTLGWTVKFFRPGSKINIINNFLKLTFF